MNRAFLLRITYRNVNTKNEANLSVIQAYIKLSHVVYKQKYLFPQRPFPPLAPKMDLSESSIFNNYKNKCPQEMTLQFEQKLKKEDGRRQLWQIYNKIYTNEVAKYNSQLIEYHKEYIEPLKSINTSIFPHFIWWIAQKKNSQKAIEVAGFKSASLIKSMFDKTSPEQKQKYQLLCIQTKRKLAEKQRRIIEMYEIPSLQKMTPKELYFRQNRSKFNYIKQVDISYANEPIQIKNQYKIRAKELSKNAFKILKQFIKKFNLSLSEFEHISQISYQMDNLRKQMKQFELNKEYMKQTLTDKFKHQLRANQTVAIQNQHSINKPMQIQIECMNVKQSPENMTKVSEAPTTIQVKQTFQLQDPIIKDDDFSQIDFLEDDYEVLKLSRMIDSKLNLKRKT